MFFGKTGAKCPDENRICLYCEHAEEVCGSEACICAYKGVVRFDGLCKKFKFDLLKVKPRLPKLPQAGEFTFD